MYAVYVSKTLRGKNEFMGYCNTLDDAMELGANATGVGYFLIQNVKTGKYVDLTKI